MTRKELEQQHADDFARAWNIYPRPERRAASFDAYIWAIQNFNDDGMLPQRIYDALTWQVRQTPEARFWTRFANWLLDRRWEDEPLRVAAVFDQDDPMYPQYETWQRVSGPDAAAITFQQFKRYAEGQRDGRVQ